jgi:tetratricopeptide (TPR) repeat protein
MDFRALYKEGKFAEALTALEQSPEAAQKSYTYYLNRGIVHHALNQDPLAVAYLSKAKAMDPDSTEVDGPLNEATAGLAKWMGVQRLDATSYGIETLGEKLPLDAAFFLFAAISVVSWFGFFLAKKRRGFFTRLGFTTLVLTALFGLWSYWLEQHPLVITTEARMVKSGPGESFLDRGNVDPGMKLRVVGQMFESSQTEKPERWWKVRFNDRSELGFIPERSGLLLTDESNTPER